MKPRAAMLAVVTTLLVVGFRVGTGASDREAAGQVGLSAERLERVGQTIKAQMSEVTASQGGRPDRAQGEDRILRGVGAA